MLVGLPPRYLIEIGIAWIVVVTLGLAFIYFRLWRARSRIGKWLVRGYLVLVAISFVSLAAESLFTLLYSTTDAFSLSLVSKRWNERFVERNNWNCRDSVRYTGPKPVGTKRLTIVGDSFAFGHGVRDISRRFGDRLRQTLRRNSANWQVYNIAEPGANTGWELNRLRELAQKDQFETDYILLAYCLNDIEDLVPGTYEIVGTIINDPPRNYICQNFFLPNFLYYRLNHFRRPEVAGYFGWLVQGYQGEIWQKQQERLRDVKAWCVDHHAKLLVVVFPFMVGFQTNYAFEDAHAVIGKFCDAEKIPYVDLLSTYRQHAGETLTVNPFDAHPNERAHELAAEAIADKMISADGSLP